MHEAELFVFQALGGIGKNARMEMHFRVSRQYALNRGKASMDRAEAMAGAP
jgi:Holliday junction resolvasome RuvABC endonuclease subunit